MNRKILNYINEYKNAMDLVNSDAALILEEKDLTKEALISLIDKTIDDKEKLLSMKKNLNKLAVKDSSTRIYNVLKDLIMDERKFY